MSPALLTEVTARGLLDTVSMVLLAVVVASVLVYRLDTAIGLLAVQGGLLAVAAITVALATGMGHAYVAALLTLLVKAIAVPLMLLRVLRRAPVRMELEPVISRKLAFPLAVGLVLFAYFVTGPLVAAMGYLTSNTMPAAVAVLLLGFYTMLLRRKALSQIIALITMENGLYLAAVIATRGLPLAVEMGIALDV
ncbi:MAG: formate hydrogenlyase, partial [Chloroflexota bacterium]